MQLTTILAVLFSSLLLFALAGYADSTIVRNRLPLNHAKPHASSGVKFLPRQARIIKDGHHQSVGRAMFEAYKQRRRH
jgi:hypothetical protein